MRGANNNNYYNPSASSRRGGSRNPYSNIFDENPDDTAGGVDDDDDGTPSSLKLIGPLVPLLLSDDWRNDIDGMQNRLRTYAASCLATSAFFWTWALINTSQLRSGGGNGFDMGVVSFLGSGASSSLLLRSASGGRCRDVRNRKNRRCCGFGGRIDNKDDDDDEGLLTDAYGRLLRNSRDATADGNGPGHVAPGKCLRLFALLTQVAVVANYALGVLFAFTAGARVYVYFATYCAVFSFLWATSALAGWVLVDAYRAALGRAYGEEFLDGPSRGGGGGGGGPLRWALIALTNRSMGGRDHAGGRGGGAMGADDDGRYRDEEDDDIDDELRALYEGRGGYTNA